VNVTPSVTKRLVDPFIVGRVMVSLPPTMTTLPLDTTGWPSVPVKVVASAALDAVVVVGEGPLPGPVPGESVKVTPSVTNRLVDPVTIGRVSVSVPPITITPPLDTISRPSAPVRVIGEEPVGWPEDVVVVDTMVDEVVVDEADDADLDVDGVCRLGESVKVTPSVT
jgi:hypothetical protein